MKGTLSDVLSETIRAMNNGTTDMTKNGKCTGCGECCTNFLPMNRQEIETIKKYVKRHHIEPHTMPKVLSRQSFDATCPFLDLTKGTERCKIYPVRPEICREFCCHTASFKDAMRSSNDKLWDGTRKAVNVRKEIYGIL